MKIALIKHKTSYANGIDIEGYRYKINGILNETKADMIVGPELAITNGSPLHRVELENFYQNLIMSDKLIIPGTAFVYSKHPEEYLWNRAVILSEDMPDKKRFFNKKSPIKEERDIAKDKDLKYKVGDPRDGLFRWKDYKIALEIGNDHNEGKLKQLRKRVQGINLEFILACNDLKSIYTSNLLVENGTLCVIDGAKEIESDEETEEKEYAPKVEAYNVIKGKLEQKSGKETDDYLLIDID